MASRESMLVSKLYRTWLTQPDDDELITNRYGWDVLTSEPGGVDYLEIDAGGVAALSAVPRNADRSRVLLCLHGGGYISGSMFTHRKMFAHIAKAAGARALIINYRLLPDGAYPKPVDDVVSAYRFLLEEGISPEHIAFTGDSAGGGLSITGQLRAREQGLPLPATAMPISAWVDMEVTGESMTTNRDRDALFTREWIKQLADDYLAGADAREPYASPIHADLTGLGPIYLQVGDQELLLDESRSLAAAAERAGVEVRLDVFPGQQHTFQMMAGRAPEADDAVNRLAEWTRDKLGLAVPARR
jgi:monoterpene epsilon-lactone hydrolase